PDSPGPAADQGQATQIDHISDTDADADGVGGRGYRDPALDAVRGVDADRLGDRYRAVAGAVEYDDLAAGIGLGDRPGKAAARRGETARVRVRPRARDKSAVRLRLGWPGGGQQSRNARSGDDKGCSHRCAPMG